MNQDSKKYIVKRIEQYREDQQDRLKQLETEELKSQGLSEHGWSHEYSEAALKILPLETLVLPPMTIRAIIMKQFKAGSTSNFDALAFTRRSMFENAIKVVKAKEKEIQRKYERRNQLCRDHCRALSDKLVLSDDDETILKELNKLFSMQF